MEPRGQDSHSKSKVALVRPRTKAGGTLGGGLAGQACQSLAFSDFLIFALPRSLVTLLPLATSPGNPCSPVAAKLKSPLLPWPRSRFLASCPLALTPGCGPAGSASFTDF